MQQVSPQSVAIDSGDNLYVGTGTGPIFKVSPDGRVLANFVNDPNASYGGIALDSQNNLYASVTAGPNGSSSYVIKFGPEGRREATWSIQGKAPIDLGGIAADLQGNVYIADSQNHRIQRLSPSGSVAAVWGQYGTGPGQFSQPDTVAVDQKGNVFVADRLRRVQKLTADGHFLAEWAAPQVPIGSRSSASGVGVTVDRQGDVWVNDSGLGKAYHLAPDLRVMDAWRSHSFGGVEAPSLHANGIAVDRSENIYIIEPNRLQKYSRSGQSLGSMGVGALGQFQAPAGIAVDNAGNLYVADLYGIQKTLADGTSVDEWRSIGSGADDVLGQPAGLAIDRSGKLYVADAFQSGLLVLSLDGKLLARLPGPPKSTTYPLGPSTVAVGPDGAIYVTFPGRHLIQKLSPAGQVLSEWRTPGGEDKGVGPGDPFQVAVGRRGAPYVTTLGSPSIVSLGSGGSLGNSVTLSDASGVLPDSLIGIAIDSQENFYVTSDANMVFKVSPQGRVMARWGGQGTAAGQFFGPLFITIDDQGTVYVTENRNKRVQKLSVGLVT